MVRMYIDFAPMETTIFVVDDEAQLVRSSNFFNYRSSSMQMPDLAELAILKARQYGVDEIIVIGMLGGGFAELLVEKGVSIDVKRYKEQKL